MAPRVVLVSSRPHASLLLAFLLLMLLPSTLLVRLANANISFKVYKGSKLSARRQGRRLLDAAKMGIWGGGPEGRLPQCYYAELRLGDSDKVYHPEVDTTTDFSWLNCKGCTTCPDHTDLEKMKLTFYDYGDKSKRVKCSNQFCKKVIREKEDLCNDEEDMCRYKYLIDEGYGSSSGYLVNDTLTLETFTDDGKNMPMEVPFVLGCGVIQKGTLDKNQTAVDGILSLGHSNTSFISQVALHSNVKRMFGHCFSNRIGGGGVFVIGEVYMDNFRMQSAVYDPKKEGYSLTLKGIEVGNKVLFNWTKESEQKEVQMDIAGGLTYLPKNVYYPVRKKIILDAGMEAKEEDNGRTCFKLRDSDSLDHMYVRFPNVTLTFAPNAVWTITPQSYLYRPMHNAKGVKRACLSMVLEAEGGYMLGGSPTNDRVISYNLDENTINWVDEHVDCENPDGMRVKGSDGKIIRVPYTRPLVDNMTATKQIGMGNCALLLLLCIVFYSLLP